MTMLVDIITYEEGFVAEPYRDSLGYPTIGIGKKIGNRDNALTDYVFTLPLPVAQEWLDYDLTATVEQIASNEETYTPWHICNQPRKDILASMSYQLGFEGLCEFQSMLAALEDEDFERAADEMLDSVWHTQTPERCERESDVMRKGDYSPYQGLV